MRKPPDLSNRGNGILLPHTAPIFSRRNANPTGTLTFAAAGTLDLFKAPASCTVLWIVLQVRASATIQIYKNGEALSLPYNCNAGAILHYCGMLLSGNEKLSIVSNAAVSIDYELAYVQEHHEHLTVTDIYFFNAPGAVLTDAPTGTEPALATRPIFRKKTTVLSRTPLAAGATFTSQWFDSELDGTCYVELSARSDQTGTQLAIFECDDISSITYAPASIQSPCQSVSYTANTATRAPAVIRQRYYQFIFTNGATPQTTFLLTATVCNFMIPGALSGGVVSTGALTVSPFPIFVNQGGGGVGADALVNVNDIPGTAGAFPMRNVLHAFNGATWDRIRNNVNGTTGDSGAKVATFNGATQTNFDAVGAYITVLLGAVSGTTPTLTMQLQYSPDGGTTWLNLGPASATLTTSSQTAVLGIFATNFSQTPGATPANLTTGATVSTFINAPLPRTWRIVYTIAGTTPSFTISSVQVNYIRG